MPRPEMMGPASLAIGQSVGAFLAFLPKFSDIRRADTASDSAMVRDVRMGEMAATTVCIGIGAITSSITGDPLPAIVSAVMALILIALYETALKVEA